MKISISNLSPSLLFIVFLLATLANSIPAIRESANALGIQNTSADSVQDDSIYTPAEYSPPKSANNDLDATSTKLLGKRKSSLVCLTGMSGEWCHAFIGTYCNVRGEMRKQWAPETGHGNCARIHGYCHCMRSEVWDFFQAGPGCSLPGINAQFCRGVPDFKREISKSSNSSNTDTNTEPQPHLLISRTPTTEQTGQEHDDDPEYSDIKEVSNMTEIARLFPFSKREAERIYEEYQHNSTTININNTSEVNSSQRQSQQEDPEYASTALTLSDLHPKDILPPRQLNVNPSSAIHSLESSVASQLSVSHTATTTASHSLFSRPSKTEMPAPTVSSAAEGEESLAPYLLAGFFVGLSIALTVGVSLY